MHCAERFSFCTYRSIPLHPVLASEALLGRTVSIDSFDLLNSSLVQSIGNTIKRKGVEGTEVSFFLLSSFPIVFL